MSAGNPYNYDPQFAPPKKSNTGVIIAIVAAVVAVPVLLMCAGILIALLLPAVQASREAARRMSCSNNMKQIALALHNYADANGSFPPAYTEDSNGNRLHSWRTLILPYVEQQHIFDQIDLDKPWDDPANASLASISVPIFSCPSAPLGPGLTTYVAVQDPSGIFKGPIGTKFSEITDGTSNTLLFTETDAAQAVPWMSPNDIDMQAFMNGGSDQHAHARGNNISLADGSVQFISESLPPETRQGLVTRNGQEPPSFSY